MLISCWHARRCSLTLYRGQCDHRPTPPSAFILPALVVDSQERTRVYLLGHRRASGRPHSSQYRGSLLHGEPQLGLARRALLGPSVARGVCCGTSGCSWLAPHRDGPNEPQPVPACRRQRWQRERAYRQEPGQFGRAPGRAVNRHRITRDGGDRQRSPLKVMGYDGPPVQAVTWYSPEEGGSFRD